MERVITYGSRWCHPVYFQEEGRYVSSRLGNSTLTIGMWETVAVGEGYEFEKMGEYDYFHHYDLPEDMNPVNMSEWDLKPYIWMVDEKKFLPPKGSPASERKKIRGRKKAAETRAYNKAKATKEARK